MKAVPKPGQVECPACCGTGKYRIDLHGKNVRECHRCKGTGILG